MRIFPYLRASTTDQHVDRARGVIEAFLSSHESKASAWFVETQSGATLKRPVLFQLLDIMEPGDVILVEQVDRLSRLNAANWNTLKAIVQSKGIRIVALDLPTSHNLLTAKSDDFTARVLEAVNAMMLDMLAATSRKDYEDRRRRQKEGIAKAVKQKKYRGRPVNQALHDSIATLLDAHISYNEIMQTLGCSRGTIARVKKEMVQTGCEPA